MAENQAAHRMELEKKVVDANIQRSKAGLVAGFGVATMGFVLSGYLGSLGMEAAAISVAGVDLAGLVAVFVYGRNSQKRELDEKNKEVPERR